eukprot:s3865_g1.t1
MQFDDDMPLASLATSTPQKPSKASTVPHAATAKGKGKGGAKGKAKVKAAAKRSAKESSSSSSSSSGSDSDSSDGGEGEEKSKKAMGDVADQDEDADEDKEDAANNVVKKRDRTTKQQAVSDLLCRWWYVLPDWPPNNKDDCLGIHFGGH